VKTQEAHIGFNTINQGLRFKGLQKEIRDNVKTQEAHIPATCFT